MIQDGYTGKILRINLQKMASQEEEISEEMARKYIGGAGFGIKYLFDEVSPEIDPLSAENKIIFAPGPFTGTSVPSASRMAAVTKSPLTGAVGMSLSGGHFPAELKFSGYDAIIIEGKADKPCYIYITENNVHFLSADKIWGTKTSDCQQIIKDDLQDQNIRIACIGPAGENKVLYSSIINERRAFGRKGLGAVMGSKNLKAIAVRGNKKPTIADKKAFKKARSNMLKAMKNSEVLYTQFSVHGTPMTVDVTGELGIFPTRNWSTTGEWQPVDKLGKDANTSRKVGRIGCYNCPVSCSQIKLAREGKYAGELSEGPEFETIYSLGSTLGIDNIDTVIAADRLCDELGIDTISAGVTIGFAMEMYEKGILTDEDTDNLNLNFGNEEALLKLLHDISYRQGLGELLSLGTKRIAEKIGQGTGKYAMQVKGLEMPAYDIRGAKAHGLNFATSYTGADHNRGYAFQEIFGIPVPEKVNRFAIEGKGKLTKWNQDIRTATCDCAPMCAFLLDMAVPDIACENTAAIMKSLTGVDIAPEEVEAVGERVNNLARVYNILAGFGREDDTFPGRVLEEPLSDGNSQGEYIGRKDLNKMLDEYYEVRGWTSEGLPTRGKLFTLGLDKAAEALWP